ncbi:type IX secretion system anionic LPS delivery protein PorZ [Polaribacter sp.]|uniref:type IX secretion system anionic LPS delivery protein PorZ n=1 Tax=Polaribacter sp. TaxID=1920175 RepID=UPI0040487245
MKNILYLLLFLFSTSVFSQVDYSDSWEDFYSYNNVKDFVKVDNQIFALVDNAVFTFDETTSETKKISSIQGLSGEITSAIYYHESTKRLVIGYENGLIEVIDEDNSITISSDLANFNQSGEKRVNHISGFGNTLYLSTPFAIVEYDIEKLEFGDTFFIGNNSSSLRINETTILNNTIFAVTAEGIFSADITNNLLIDFNNWTQQFAGRNFSHIVQFNNQLFVTENSKLFQVNGSSLIEIKDYFQPILGVKSSNTHLSISLQKSASILNSSMNEIAVFGTSSDFDFSLSNAFFENNTIYLATHEFGILKSTSTQSTNYQEIHPEGPLSNEVYSIDANNKHLWVVFGGYDQTYTPIQRRRGFSHFNGQNWINTPFNPNFPFIDLNYVSIDPNAENKVFISSAGDTNDINSVSTGGLLVVENDQVTTFYNHKNSTLEDIVPNELNRVTVRVSGTAFDRQGNLWVNNINFNQELKKLSTNGIWSSYDLSPLKTDSALGLSEITVDRNNTVWIGTRRNGLYVFNENGNRKARLIATPNQGNLPDLQVFSVAVDNSSRVWIGTSRGLVVFRGTSSIFDATVLNAQPVIIEENGVGERLLGDLRVNSIEIDGADNKWFGTDSGGVLYTNPSGQRTLANFSTQNSPLPSNRILKIRVDDSSGKVFFATDRGIVAYNSKVAPFGEVLGEVYSYPNPALKNHETVTITGRNGTSLPRGTNVKILDVAGNLVYETNVVEGQEVQGGKVVWNKKNLAGKRVASGVYIVLLAAEDGTQTAVTKIAIVN